MRIKAALTLLACAVALAFAAPRSALALPTGATGDLARSVDARTPGVVEKVHRRNWRHRHHRYHRHHRHHRRYYRPYGYSYYGSDYGYPHYYRRRPGISLYFRF